MHSIFIVRFPVNLRKFINRFCPSGAPFTQQYRRPRFHTSSPDFPHRSGVHRSRPDPLPHQRLRPHSCFTRITKLTPTPIPNLFFPLFYHKNDAASRWAKIEHSRPGFLVKIKFSSWVSHCAVALKTRKSMILFRL